MEQLTFAWGPLAARLLAATRVHDAAQRDLAVVLIEARNASWSWPAIGKACDLTHPNNWHRTAQWAGRTVAWAGLSPTALDLKGNNDGS